MRTTVTLDADVESLLEREMREKGVSFKHAVNDAIRRAFAEGAPVDYTFDTFDLGAPRVDLTHALRMAADLEDEELVRKLEQAR